MKNLVLLVLLLFSIVMWQGWAMSRPELIPADRYITGTVGGGAHHLTGYQKFFEYYKKLGLFPLAKDPQGRFVMELDDTFRMGDRAKIHLLKLSDLLTGSKNETPPIYTPANRFFFVLALCTFFAGFWLAGARFFAVASTLFLGSSSFQLYETYVNNNVFSYPISHLLVQLGIHAVFLFQRPTRLHWKWLLLAVAGGVVAGSIRQIRADALTAYLLIPGMYLFVARFGWSRRFLMSAASIGAFLITSGSWSSYFEHKFQESKSYVEANKGFVYTGPRASYHLFWHPLYCGLGDFDKTHGYQWHDLLAYEYALKILRKRPEYRNLWPSFSLDVPKNEPKGYFMDETFGSDGVYRMKLENVPDYEPIIKEKVLTDIAQEPFWYVSILLQRIENSLKNTAGIQLRIPFINLNWDRPFIGVLFILSLVLSVAFRNSTRLWILIISGSVLAPAILITTVTRIQFYFVGHIFAFVFLLSAAVIATSTWVRLNGIPRFNKLIKRKARA